MLEVSVSETDLWTVGMLLLLLCPKSPFVSFGIGVADEDDCVDSSMAARTLRNFDSDFLDIWLCVVMEPGGCEFRLASLEVGDTEGEGAVLIGGDIERGGVGEPERLRDGGGE